MTLNLFNTPADNLNDEMDKADMETNLIAEEGEENANMSVINDQSGDEKWKHTHKTKQIPILPTHKWEDGAMANDSPRCRIFYCCCCCWIHVCVLLLLLLHACVFWGVVVVTCMCFCYVVVYCWVCVCVV